MYTAISILIILVCVLLVLVVLIQNPKGGGIASGIIGANQVMGVKKTSDFIEKLTWGLAISLVVLCLAASFSLPGPDERSFGTSMQEQIDNAPAPITTPAPAPAEQPAQQEGN
ncbi:MAG: preprotein translocase subunit SecG [Bacteroidetes bacterium]|nr:MAG: preprotein translocase subunit SecG [Bacteroidota bacterium]REK03503.1 MAG: preprotein translocase subunit SecG [Bacteroidota bacterium]REK34808.1 MAG: preprotein translocase subunit SecG [Bacteroidota bacterium]REK51312.1 MAG: preprotein translocase subunit SecG [Bacteroidota bacterium]